MIFDRRKEAEEKRQIMIKYQRVFGSPEGKEVLMDILNRNFFVSPTGGDPVKAGQRDAVMGIVAMCSMNVVKAYDEFIRGEQANGTR